MGPVNFTQLYGKDSRDMADHSSTYCDVNQTRGTAWHAGDLTTDEDECQDMCRRNAACRYVTYYHEGCDNAICLVNGNQATKCRLSSECKPARSSFPPTSIFQKD